MEFGFTWVKMVQLRKLASLTDASVLIYSWCGLCSHRQLCL